ncbi:MAG: hypothetical protein ACK5TK_15865 [Betaproteobacteria bacterium]
MNNVHPLPPSLPPGGRFNLPDTDWIRFLQATDANFVFLFGNKTVGKSVILASLIHTATVTGHAAGLSFIKTLDFLPHQYRDEQINNVIAALRQESEIHWDQLACYFEWDAKHQTSTGFLPARTDSGRPPLLIGGQAVPNRKGLKPRNLIFLETAGEDLARLAGIGGALGTPIDVYFRARGLPMIFLLVVPWMDAAKEDEAVANFIDHVGSRNPQLRGTRFVLLLTKWDSNPRRGDIGHDLARNEMPRTWQRLRGGTDLVSEFSVGTVEMRETREIDERGGFVKAPFLAEMDPTYAVRLWSSIHDSFSIKPLVPPLVSWWRRFRG